MTVYAAQRTPPEIWWRILDEAIRIPLVFDTMYQGDHWSRDADDSMPEKENELYGKSERQRKIIGSVCRSWQVFAQARRGRRILLVPKTWILEKDRSLMAPHVTISFWSVMAERFSMTLPSSVNWEILQIEQSGAAKLLSMTTLPRLRRLKLQIGGIEYDPNPFLDVLDMYPDLTRLDCQLYIGRGTLNVPFNEARKPVTLPKLQALWYRCREPFGFPVSRLLLPSLQYLAIHFSAPASHAPLIELLSTYRHTIRAVIVNASIERWEVPSVHFPPWNDFPNLEDLTIDRQWPIHFQLLPPNHPLKRLDAHHASFDAIPSLVDGTHMRNIVLQKAHWSTTGQLVGEKVELKFSATEMDRLLDKARLRGIRVEVARDKKEGQTRDEAITAIA
ncbi:hypothetical protein CPB86DRAFT_797381 [Serendipita vermifera]|nr:hypothetical protein CPB86DRAFT_797381 [Serendipita vermifera]